MTEKKQKQKQKLAVSAAGEGEAQKKGTVPWKDPDAGGTRHAPGTEARACGMKKGETAAGTGGQVLESPGS